jgi:formylmethanofuran dehydrogenase subunit E
MRFGKQHEGKSCRCCGDSYVWNDGEYLNDPGICMACDGNECMDCGKFVAPKDRKSKDWPMCLSCQKADIELNQPI